LFTQLLAATASVALIGAGAVAPSSIRSSEAMPSVQSAVADGDGAGASDMCRVDVVRTGQSGTVTSTRAVLKDNSCVCTLVTGPAGNNGNAEDVITAMLRDRSCPNSPMVGQPVSEAAEANHGGLVIPVLVGVVAAAGLAVALSAKSRG
jgi:hypothetical protein